MGKSYIGSIIAGTAAGAVTGLFGAGGGMVLIPLLTLLTQISEEEIFPSSISIILPICLVSLCIAAESSPLFRNDTFPWLIGSALGGLLAGLLGKKIPILWLHKILGILILWGGWRYLWS